MRPIAMAALAAALLALSPAAGALRAAEPLVIDHTVAHSHQELFAIGQVPIEAAKAKLHVAYGHTSHGSQLITGMNTLDPFMQSKHGTPSGLYTWNEGGTGGALDIDDYFVSGDLGNPDWVTWAARTRTYLANPANADVNVVIWSWCGQVSAATVANINTYLGLMTGLENDYPDITFVYMTGHLDGTGATGNLNVRNQQIRDYCAANDKVLYDFADIESYDPDKLVNYMPLLCTDNCDYDSDGNGTRDRNWAITWQNAHPGEWYSCSAAHSQPLNGNLKAYAAWALWAGIAERREAAPIESWEVLCTHGPAGQVVTAMTDGYVEPRQDGLREFRITFTEAVDETTLTAGAVTITGQATGDQSTRIGSMTLDATDKILTVTLNSSLPDGDTYTLAVTDQVKAAGGEDLEGDRDVQVRLLAGDVNRSGAVSAADILAARAAAGQAISGANAACDVDRSGTVSGADLLAVRGRL